MRRKPKALTVRDRAIRDGQRWIQSENAMDCTDKEMLEEAELQAFYEEGAEAREEYKRAFLEGCMSMLHEEP